MKVFSFTITLAFFAFIPNANSILAIDTFEIRIVLFHQSLIIEFSYITLLNFATFKSSTIVCKFLFY